jgi:hypothetical protein
MRIVVALLLGLLAAAAVAGAVGGMFLIPCVIVAVVAAAAAAFVATEQFFWRLAAYAGAFVAVLGALVVGTRVAIGACAYAIAIVVLTWAAPLRPRRSRLDHLASSSARTA